MTQDSEDLAELVELATERHWLAGLSLPEAKLMARAEILDLRLNDPSFSDQSQSTGLGAYSDGGGISIPYAP